MASPSGKHKIPKECFNQEKCLVAALRNYSPTKSFTEMMESDDLDFRRPPSEASTVYLDIGDMPISFAGEGRCFGDSRCSKSETNLKFEKEILLLSKNLMKRSPPKATFETNKVIHIDIAPENKHDEERDNNGSKQIQEIHVFNGKISVENSLSPTTFDNVSTNQFHGARTEQQTLLKKAQSQDICDEGRRKTESDPMMSRFENCRRLDSTDSNSSCKESVFKNESFGPSTIRFENDLKAMDTLDSNSSCKELVANDEHFGPSKIRFRYCHHRLDPTGYTTRSDTALKDKHFGHSNIRFENPKRLERSEARISCNEPAPEGDHLPQYNVRFKHCLKNSDNTDSNTFCKEPASKYEYFGQSNGKFENFRKGLDLVDSNMSCNEPRLSNTKLNSPEVSQCISEAGEAGEARVTAETSNSFTQTDMASYKHTKNKSKLKKRIINGFLSCVKCCM